MSHPYITVNNLSVSFDGREVLRDVSFTVDTGHVTVILGPSGCGKTTVLRHILGLYPSAAGQINIAGKDLASMREVEQTDMYLNMGVFFQNGALINSMTVAENVGLPLKQHSKLPEPLIRELVNMKLSLVNLAHAYHLYPSELSGGMLKRAALARAIAMDPPVLFCDEPGAGLDPVSLESLDRLILNLKNLLGMTVVMVTHEVASIMRVADKIVYLDEGTVAYEGPVSGVYKADSESLRKFFSVYQTPLEAS